MPQIDISEETFKQLSEFRRFSLAASEIDLPLHELADYLIQVGVDHMVTSIFAVQEPSVILASLLQMGRLHPEQTYGYMADVMLLGKEINDAKLAEFREQMQRRIGFRSHQEQ